MRTFRDGPIEGLQKDGWGKNMDRQGIEKKAVAS